MAKKGSKQKVNKLCAKCSLDCTVVRILTVENVPDSKKAEILKSRFGDGKPVYSSTNCPKKTWKK